MTTIPPCEADSSHFEEDDQIVNKYRDIKTLISSLDLDEDSSSEIVNKYRDVQNAINALTFDEDFEDINRKNPS